MRIGGEWEADLKRREGAEFALELRVKKIQQRSPQPCVWAGVFPPPNHMYPKKVFSE